VRRYPTVSASAEAVLSLNKPLTPESLTALREAARATLAEGAEQLVVDIDGAGVLDSASIAALISLLREAREQGAGVTLLAEQKGILDTLRITALDKIFTVESPRAPVPKELPVTRLRGPRHRLAIRPL